MPLAAHCYTSAQIYTEDTVKIFRENWLLVAHLQEFSTATGQIARDVCGIPLLFLKQDSVEQPILVYINTCKHRGGPLLYPNETKDNTILRCKYHGWKYTQNGSLENAPMYGAKCPDVHLTSLPVHILHGCIFVYLSKDSAPPDTTYIEDVQAWLPISRRLENCGLIQKRQHFLRCNWKVYLENYLEGYHIPFVHPELTKEIKMSTYRVSVQNREIIHHVQTTENAQSEGYWSFLWPNIAFNIYANGMNIERVIPISPNETIIEYWYFFENESDAQSTIQLSAEITQEDIEVCERIQFNMESGFYVPGPLSPKHENGIEAFQQWYSEGHKGLIE